MLILLAMLGSALIAQPAASPPPDEREIVVTGSRPDRPALGEVEAPYSETPRTPLGSRIARRVSERPFQTIATESGVAGMLQGSGMDGTGSTNAVVATRRVTGCVAEDRQVRSQIACVLFRVRQDTECGEFDAARDALAPLLRRGGLNAAETYHVGHQAYALAEAQVDGQLRAQALQLLITSGRLSEIDRVRAARTFAALTAGR